MRMRGMLLAAAVLALAAPVQAQPVAAGPGPEEDLRCAAWAAVVLGLNKDDPEAAAGLGMALAWFLARYEGATGKRFEEAMTAEFVDGLVPEMEAIELTCQPRMQAMGARFSDWGAKLQQAGQ